MNVSYNKYGGNGHKDSVSTYVKPYRDGPKYWSTAVLGMLSSSGGCLDPQNKNKSMVEAFHSSNMNTFQFVFQKNHYRTTMKQLGSQCFKNIYFSFGLSTVHAFNWLIGNFDLLFIIPVFYCCSETSLSPSALLIISLDGSKHDKVRVHLLRFT